jgi:hypothetical protein
MVEVTRRRWLELIARAAAIVAGLVGLYVADRIRAERERRAREVEDAYDRELSRRYRGE